MNKTIKEMKELYLSDDRPWIIGLSGGKDSTCVAQMVYYMLRDLPPSKRHKKVHIVSNDTLVESPIIEVRIRKTISNIRKQAEKDELPIHPKILKPALNDTFWVNLIGRGYPSPNRWFRWCTDRLKIKPTTKYIKNQVEKNGEVIILLGVRSEESASRAQSMKSHEIKDFNLRTHAEISGALIYAPIDNWSSNDVWTYLLQAPSPWGDNNKVLLQLYQKADQECPFQTDRNDDSCGNSRFGCWTCTVVDKDRSIEGLIEEGEEWMHPLLKFRNWLKKIRNDETKREKTMKKAKKRMVFSEELGIDFDAPEHRGHKVLGPFTFETRHEILKRLIELRETLLGEGMELISPEELKAIETILIYEGDDITKLADILRDGKQKKKTKDQENFDIVSICENNHISPRLIEKLIVVENDLSSLSTRVGLFGRLEQILDEYVIMKARERGC